MSWTKTEFHEEICAMMAGADEMEAAMWAAEYDEKAVDWFPDFRLDYTGYQEFDCDLCGLPNDTEFPHQACHDEQQARTDGEFQYFS